MTGQLAPFRTARLTYEDIRARADDFLEQYHPDLTVPVPIAVIVEFDLSMDIIPIDGLRPEIGVDAFLSSDGDRVFVDEQAMRISLPRYRFSLAHEVGHYRLHDRFYQQVRITDVASWKAAQQRIAAEYGWFESQANNFAGLVLAPAGPLKAAFDDRVAKAASGGYTLSDIEDFPLRPRLIQGLADEFQVSADTMTIRLEKDRLLPEL